VSSNGLHNGREEKEQLLFTEKFKRPSSGTTSSHRGSVSSNRGRLLRVAIIGGGPGGTAAAYYLARTFNSSNASRYLASEGISTQPKLNSSQLNFSDIIPSLSIDLYEKSDRVGGRCFSQPIVFSANNNTYSTTVEWGASMFVDENKNLVEASKNFDLKLIPFSSNTDSDDNRFGIWKPSQKRFEFVESNSKWKDKFNGIYRYGLSPFWTIRMVNRVVGQFLKLYDTTKGFESIEEMIHVLKMEPYMKVSAREFFESKYQFRRKWIDEMLETVTRVNYGQNLADTHVFATLVGFVQGQTWQIEGGNQQIFQGFVNHSNANVFLNTGVNRIQSSQSPSTNTYPLYTVSSSNVGDKEYDIVIMATGELHHSGIQFTNSTIPFEPTPYQHLHVTYVVGNINATTFPDPPPNIFSMAATPETFFNSVSLIRKFSDLGKSLFKVFSPNELTWEQLDTLFFDLSQDLVWRNEWDAYPKMIPRTPKNPCPPVELVKNSNVFYVNSFEPFISTMETETLSAKNIIRLLWQRFVVNPISKNRETCDWIDKWLTVL